MIASIANRLRSLSADPNSDPLEVIRLRGGIASKTPTDPSLPAVILCTVPMYGSRLLFRGYGSKSQPVDAAMAGTDSLVLLDEAHLAPHLKRLLPALAECAPRATPILNQSRQVPRLVELTATGDAAPCQRFEINADDEAHPIVKQRLDAAKPLELRVESRGEIARHLAATTEQLLKNAGAAASCLVFANSPKTARQAFGRIRKAFPESRADVLLLTGLVREHEAKHIRSRVLDPVKGMGSNPREFGCRERHFIVVATQTLEVGADIDAEFLVTEACGVRALTQRLGRLNRLGLYPHARAAYVHIPPTNRQRADSGVWPVYGSEPADLLEALIRVRGGDNDQVVNLAPRCIASVLGPPADTPRRAPEVLPALLWEWTKTTTRPDGEAPVEPYFSGIAGPQYSVSVFWRSHIPNEGERLWPRVSDREAIDVPITDLREVLKGEFLRRIASDRLTVEELPVDKLRPGDQVVLATDRGLLDAFGWNPASSAHVLDVSLRDRGLPLDQVAIERLCNARLGDNLGDLIQLALGLDDEGEEDLDQRSVAVKTVLERIRSVAPPPGWGLEEWTTYIGSLDGKVAMPRDEVARLYVRDPRPEPSSGVLDETSIAPTAVELDQHCLAVATRSKAIAERIGLSPDLCEAIGQAGRFHDAGKADRRFQRWLDPDGTRSAPIAKSCAPSHLWQEMRASAGWPRGGRHEELSCRLVRLLLGENSASNSVECPRELYRDLLLHLIISHHGNGRPLVLPVKDGTQQTVSYTVSGRTVSALADLEIVDWEQPNRFRRLNEHFGPWGLALLEATLIKSDHAVSGGAEVAL